MATGTLVPPPAASAAGRATHAVRLLAGPAVFAGVLALTDEKGRRFLVQTARIAYVEIGAADVRRVGFGVGAESAKTG